MSQSITPPITVPAPDQRESLRPAARSLYVALAIAAPLAPLAQGLSYLVSPYGNADDPARILSAAGADPTAMATLSWLSLIIGLTLVPGVITAGLAAAPQAPRLATVALLVAVPGWAAGLVLPQTDVVATALVASGAPPDTAEAILAELVNFAAPGSAAAVLIFVVGHVLGTVLLGIALYRARAVPRVIALLLTVAQPLHFVAFVVLQNTYLDVAAAWLTAIGFGAAGLSLLRSQRQP